MSKGWSKSTNRGVIASKTIVYVIMYSYYLLGLLYSQLLHWYMCFVLFGMYVDVLKGICTRFHIWYIIIIVYPPTTTSLTRLTRGGLADTRHSYTPSSSSLGNWICSFQSFGCSWKIWILASLLYVVKPNVSKCGVSPYRFSQET